VEPGAAAAARNGLDHHTNPIIHTYKKVSVRSVTVQNHFLYILLSILEKIENKPSHRYYYYYSYYIYVLYEVILGYMRLFPGDSGVVRGCCGLGRGQIKVLEGWHELLRDCLYVPWFVRKFVKDSGCHPFPFAE